MHLSGSISTSHEDRLIVTIYNSVAYSNETNEVLNANFSVSTLDELSEGFTLTRPGQRGVELRVTKLGGSGAEFIVTLNGEPELRFLEDDVTRTLPNRRHFTRV